MEIPSSARFLKSGFGSSSLKDYTLRLKGTVRLSAYLIDKKKEKKKRKRGDILINLE